MNIDAAILGTLISIFLAMVVVCHYLRALIELAKLPEVKSQWSNNDERKQETEFEGNTEKDGQREQDHPPHHSEFPKKQATHSPAEKRRPKFIDDERAYLIEMAQREDMAARNPMRC